MSQTMQLIIQFLVLAQSVSKMLTKTPIDAMWEQMNKGISSNTMMSFLNEPSSTVNKNSSKKSNKWITYLGLVQKETGSIGQDMAQNGQNGISDDDKKIDAMWEKMNEGVPKRTFRTFSSKPSSNVMRTSQKISNNWMKNLQFASRKAGSTGQDALPEYSILPQKRPGVTRDDTGDDTKRLAAAALSAVKEAAAAAALGKGKVGITEVRDFAGQEIEFKKFVDADSKEASEKAKAPASSAVDAVLEQIKKKPKLSVLDKTKKDWGEFKEEQKLEEELDAYKKSSNQYLDKVSFLQRADYREFERERDARLALQARRRPDMREEP
ncbi:Craniofacial development protein 1 [Melia azedarach]|uniref:Craniofacial development protein 1 n=1 Tax=Melia azedarach TaxID=155640 RepID=A0ACC1YDQ7_MELAZ|nr:Craniofacial development protein 1 [Melia azedarach]